ncbi:MAG: FAD-binding protein [Conexibacter sp.]|nr:FAD-binding protein [Conexibacter sp.]
MGTVPADVVVVGSGIAGLATALAAHELGLRPVLLEKGDLLGGQTAHSWGMLWVAGTALAAAAGHEDDAERATAYLRFIGGGAQDEDRMRSFLEHGPEAVRFFAEAGVPLRLVPGVTDHYFDFAPGSAESGRLLETALVGGARLGPWAELIHRPPGEFRLAASEMIAWGGLNSTPRWDPELLARRRAADTRGLGHGLVAAFVAALHDRGVPIHLGAEASRLLTCGGRVHGVQLADGRRFQDALGVVLATGGYDSDPGRRSSLDGLPGQVSMSPPSVTGDGLVMAAELGGDIRRLPDNLLVLLGFELSAQEAGVRHPTWWAAGEVEAASEHAIIVNDAGRRFGNEAHFQYLVPKLRDFDPIRRRHRNLPCFLIFDEQYTQRFTFAGRPPGAPIPEWVARADTPAELAVKLGVDAAGLVATLADFNPHAADGVDPVFQRGEERWRLAAPSGEGPGVRLAPVDTPPFYGVRLHPTFGPSAGLAADRDGRVLDVRGAPMPGLYACGNAAASTEFGIGYQAGMTLSSGLVFGLLAARHIGGGVPCPAAPHTVHDLPEEEPCPT